MVGVEGLEVSGLAGEGVGGFENREESGYLQLCFGVLYSYRIPGKK